MSDQITVTQTRTRCRHIHAAGHQCGSPALRKRTFCYYHDATRRPHPDRHSFRYLDHNKMSFVLPVLEDHRSVILALSQIASRVASNDLDPIRARILVDTIRATSVALSRESRDAAQSRAHTAAGHATQSTAVTASSLASRTSSSSSRSEAEGSAARYPTPEPVENPTFDPSWGPLAPILPFEDARDSSCHSERSEEPPHFAPAATEIPHRAPEPEPTLPADGPNQPPQTENTAFPTNPEAAEGEQSQQAGTSPGVLATIQACQSDSLKRHRRALYQPAPTPKEPLIYSVVLRARLQPCHKGYNYSVALAAEGMFET